MAFDTLYAEGQRRYVESLSSYARQFLGRMSKPECDFIKGIPPAIAIEQKVNSRNPRSTVGTSTEIYEYLRLLYARVGKTYSPISGQLVKKHSIEDIVNCMLSFPKGTKYTVLTPMMPREGRTLLQQLEMDLKQGFTRIEVNREIVRIEDFLQQTAAEDKKQNIYLLVDRMTADDSKDSISRLTDSAETSNFYCIYGHDNEVSCNGFLFYGSSKVMRLALSAGQSSNLHDIVRIFRQESVIHDNLQEEMLRIVLKRFIITCTRIARQLFGVGQEKEKTFDIIRQYYVLVDRHFKEKKQVQDYADILCRSPKTLSNLFSGKVPRVSSN